MNKLEQIRSLAAAGELLLENSRQLRGAGVEGAADDYLRASLYARRLAFLIDDGLALAQSAASNRGFTGRART